jgi:hypothetical protein
MGEGTRLRPGEYEVYVDLRTKGDALKRYSVGRHRVQEGQTTGPIEVRLYEIRKREPVEERSEPGERK